MRPLFEGHVLIAQSKQALVESNALVSVQDLPDVELLVASRFCGAKFLLVLFCHLSIVALICTLGSAKEAVFALIEWLVVLNVRLTLCGQFPPEFCFK